VRILHTSDLHGEWRKLLQAQDFDLWVDSGDFFPNITRGKSVEPAFQQAWFTTDRMNLKKRFRARSEFWPTRKAVPPYSGSIAAELKAWLKGRPVLSISGNHDWVNLADMLTAVGYGNAWNLGRGPIETEGVRFAGFREVPFVTGEWQGELPFRHMGVAKAERIVELTMLADPEILVTHTPPQGILDFSGPKGGHAGMKELTNWLTYKPHKVKLHLFGHIHDQPGMKKELGITFSNAAQGGRIIEV